MSANLDWMLDSPTLETPKTIDGARSLRREARAQCISALKKETLADILTELPPPGHSLHMVSNGSFDYWLYCPIILSLLGRPATAFYGSTWTMSRANVLDMFDLFDAGKIGSLTVMTGLYFKRRESAVCNTLVTGLLERGQRYLAFKNHAKVMLLSADPDFVTVEGSANFTANPRLEQTVITNDRAVYDFHRGWMEEMLEAANG